MTHTLVLDIGKTHIKLLVLDAAFGLVFTQQIKNSVIQNTPPYPHYDTEGIWRWFLLTTKEITKSYVINAISISTHGAAAALVDLNSPTEENASPLSLPVLDYEFYGIESCNEQYNIIRPDFSETCSPNLPQGLNLGRQLFWQEKQFPKAFQKTTHILLYPQYWAWKLSGVLASEVSSLGCHTDLWNPHNGEYSTLVKQCQWRDKFPIRLPANAELGQVLPSLKQQMGLPQDCKVYTGIHDSNASFLRYARTYQDKPFTVVSTGTWAIVMASGVSLSDLQAERDTLANVDYRGQPVACSRSMAGREFELICKELGGDNSNKQYENWNHPDNIASNRKKLQTLIYNETFALPNFSPGSGPFPECAGKIISANTELTAELGPALASLYCALLLDCQLDLLNSQGEIILEGAFLKNILLCQILAQLRPQQKILLSADDTGTVLGCAQLANWQKNQTINLSQCQGENLQGLINYRKSWHEAIKNVPVKKSS